TSCLCSRVVTNFFEKMLKNDRDIWENDMTTEQLLAIMIELCWRQISRSFTKSLQVQAMCDVGFEILALLTKPLYVIIRNISLNLSLQITCFMYAKAMKTALFFNLVASLQPLIDKSSYLIYIKTTLELSGLSLNLVALKVSNLPGVVHGRVEIIPVLNETRSGLLCSYSPTESEIPRQIFNANIVQPFREHIRFEFCSFINASYSSDVLVTAIACLGSILIDCYIMQRAKRAVFLFICIVQMKSTKENEIQGTNHEQKTEEHLMKKNIKYKKGNEILPAKKINESLEKGSRDETIDPTSELRRLRKENDDIKKEIINKDAIIQIFQNDSKMKENMRLHRDNDIMRREIQDLREKTDERKSEVQNLQQQVREEQKRATYQIRYIQQEKENEIQQLREENIKKNNENRQLREENIKTDNEIRELRQENADIIEDFISTIFADSKSVVVSNEKLGTGAWGTVYTGDFYGTTVAVKKFHQIILSPHNKKIIQREIEIASQCRHPNLLQFICATENYQHHLLIVTERMDMTLRTLLEQRAREKSRLEYQEIKSISLDVACGLNYLHSKTPKPIIHRDISSANVLLFIKNGEVRRAKISDYGSANIMQACNTPNPGAAIYAAPEARQAQQDPKNGKPERNH
ncbi:probable serine threonine- kinase DDB_G0271682, partial [Paramuricea clavata]